MKKTLIIIALCAPVWVCGQMLREIDLSKQDKVLYMEVYVSKEGFSKHYFAKADIGAGLKAGEHGFQEDGKDKDFKSPMDVLNWLAGFGWSLERDWEDGGVRHFLMRRDKV